MDALLLNEAMLHYRAEVVHGYPRGNLNLPMGGDLCMWNPTPYCRVARFSTCESRDMLRAMQHNYYFAHKLGCGRFLEC